MGTRETTRRGDTRRSMRGLMGRWVQCSASTLRRTAWAWALAGCANTASGTTGTGMDAGTSARVDSARADVVDVAMVPDAPITVPRLIRPYSNMIATHRRPELRWELPAGITDVTVRICRDRACTAVEHTLRVQGTRVRPSEDLAPGVHFWNVEASVDGGVARSHTWAFRTLHGQREVDTTWEGGADFNGDGCSDLIVAIRTRETVDVQVVYGGRDRSLRLGERLRGEPLVLIGEFFNNPSWGDMDGDGFTDLVLTQPGSRPGTSIGRVVYYGANTGLDANGQRMPLRTDLGNGVFPPIIESTGFSGDLNDDGIFDMVTIDSVRPSPTVQRPQAVSARGRVIVVRDMTPLELDTDTMMSQPAEATDLDGDGLNDLVYGLPTATSSTSRGIVFFGPASPTLASVAEFDLADVLTPDAPSAVVADARCDLNGDGRGEILFRPYPVALTPLALIGVDSNRSLVRAATIEGPAGSTVARCVPDRDGDGRGELVGWIPTQGGRFALAIAALDSAPGAIRARLESLRLDGDDLRCDRLSAFGDADGDGLADLMCLSINGPPGMKTVSIVYGSTSTEAIEVRRVTVPSDQTLGLEFAAF